MKKVKINTAAKLLKGKQSVEVPINKDTTIESLKERYGDTEAARANDGMGISQSIYKYTGKSYKPLDIELHDVRELESGGEYIIANSNHPGRRKTDGGGRKKRRKSKKRKYTKKRKSSKKRRSRTRRRRR